MATINMTKEYKIKTIKEIEDIITKDNVECFKTDFCRWLDILVGLRTAEKILGDKFGTGWEKMNDGMFKWIDDGKNNIKIKCQINSRPI
jgi:hypothetical protein